jgi:hypothetical protein
MTNAIVLASHPNEAEQARLDRNETLRAIAGSLVWAMLVCALVVLVIVVIWKGRGKGRL